MKRKYFFKFLYILSSLLFCSSLLANNFYLKRSPAPSSNNDTPYYGLISDYARVFGENNESASANLNFNTNSNSFFTINGCPGPISINNDSGLCTAFVNYSIPTTDIPSGSMVQIDGTGYSSGSAFPVGITTQTWEERDASNVATGNTCSFTVTVNDNEDPVTPSLADVTGECSATATAPTTTDACAGTITGTTSDPLTYN
ncbi:HYR domain-containing protein, partial [Aestuariivivens marinum]|uniref:HYR domain-containing protein n=1 Tax=Aestuariivivens marinum TaxID=2913555 RepID=UPI001F59DE7F